MSLEPHFPIIRTALEGYCCEHYDGRKTRPFKSRRIAQLVSRVLGEGWFVRDVRHLALLVSEARRNVIKPRPAKQTIETLSELPGKI